MHAKILKLALIQIETFHFNFFFVIYTKNNNSSEVAKN